MRGASTRIYRGRRFVRRYRRRGRWRGLDRLRASVRTARRQTHLRRSSSSSSSHPGVWSPARILRDVGWVETSAMVSGAGGPELDEVKRRRCPDLGGGTVHCAHTNARREARRRDAGSSSAGRAMRRGVPERGLPRTRSRVCWGGGREHFSRERVSPPRPPPPKRRPPARRRGRRGSALATEKRTRDDGRVVIVDARGGRVGGRAGRRRRQSSRARCRGGVVARRVAERDDARVGSSLIRRPRVRGLVHERETTLDVARAEGNRGVERHARGGGRLAHPVVSARNTPRAYQPSRDSRQHPPARLPLRRSRRARGSKRRAPSPSSHACDATLASSLARASRLLSGRASSSIACVSSRDGNLPIRE